MPDAADWNRRSIRLATHDYQRAGTYFITLVTYERARLFGVVRAGKVRLNRVGEIVDEEWRRTAVLRPRVHLDAYVIMPDHMHMLFTVGPRGGRSSTSPAPTTFIASRGAAPPACMVGADCSPPLRCATTDGHHARRPPAIAAPRVADSLGSIIAGFKAAATVRVNELRKAPGRRVWQRGYYDRIIWDERGVRAVRRYIVGNPRRAGEISLKKGDARVAPTGDRGSW